jgi:peptide/nickel transport system substrate-binding protein
MTARPLFAVAAIVVAALVGGCGGSSSSSSSKTSTGPPLPVPMALAAQPRSTLTMESSQESVLPDNFNPFDSTSAANGVGATALIYETLLKFDIADPLQPAYEFLATNYVWGNAGRSITFTIRRGVKWSNGSRLTPADVAFTYNMLVRYPDTNSNAVPVTGATVSGDDVMISFSSPQYTNLQNIGSVYIVPRSIWGALNGDPSRYADTHPIGSGPYVLAAFGRTVGVTLAANQRYWGGPWNPGGGAPAVKQVDFPLLDSNSAVLSTLEDNTLDWAGNFLYGLGPFKRGAGHATWFAPVNTNSLEPNERSWPLNQLAVRQAVSLAIDRNAISKIGEGGLEPPVSNASGLVLPNFQSLLASAVRGDTLSPTADPLGADSVLSAAGYTLRGGWYALNGRTIDITITDPSDYIDYAADDKLIVSELAAAHIKAHFDGLSDTQWYADLADGKYGSATCRWSYSVVVPYGMYENWLDSRLDTPTNASGDFEGLDNQTVDSELSALAGQTTIAGQLSDLAPIEKFVATDLPVIPTVYGVVFDEYNTAKFSGWPTPHNEYESGSPNAPTDEVIVLHLKPRA